MRKRRLVPHTVDISRRGLPFNGAVLPQEIMQSRDTKKDSQFFAQLILNIMRLNAAPIVLRETQKTSLLYLRKSSTSSAVIPICSYAYAGMQSGAIAITTARNPDSCFFIIIPRLNAFFYILSFKLLICP